MAESESGEAREEAGREEVAAALPDGDMVHQTLVFLARSLVEHPDDVRVEESPGDRGTIYHLHVHPDDIGRLIGRGGRMARSIRQVARAAAAREDVFAIIEIGD